MSDVIRRCFTLSGEVQGVGYRSWAHFHATRLSLVGQVRNCSDGTVQVIAQGTSANLATFEQLLKTGPPFAMGAEIESINLPPDDALTTFNLVQ